MAKLGQNNYGKSRVRLVKLTRQADRHELLEVSVDSALEGDFEAVHTEGDNGKCLPTDTQKNTVYALARKHDFASIEDFGLLLGRHFVSTQSKVVSSARIDLSQSPWVRMAPGGVPHPYAFASGGNERRTARVVVGKGGGATVSAGLNNLLVLKTTESEFHGYIRDEYTTLKETKDRIFATSVSASWTYNRDTLDFNGAFAAIRTALVDTFARHYSLSVQQTLFAMGESALAACPHIDAIRLSLPNKHCLLVNLEPFGMDNPNTIFVPTDEPHGLIEATIER